jgi:hypothetical protein
MARKRRPAGGLGWRRNRGQRGEEAEEEEESKCRSISLDPDSKVLRSWGAVCKSNGKVEGRVGTGATCRDLSGATWLDVDLWK